MSASIRSMQLAFQIALVDSRFTSLCQVIAMKSAAAHYANIYSLSSTTNQAWLRLQPFSSELVLTALRSARDIDENSFRQFVETSRVNSTETSLDIHLLQSTEVVKCSLMDISPSGQFTINLNVGKEEKPFIALNSKNAAIPSLKIDASSIHGKFMGDTWFGGCSWSSDEKYFAYVALSKEQEKVASFDKKEGKNKFDYVEDWGEKYEGVVDLNLCILNTESGEIKIIAGISNDMWTVGQPVFKPTPAGAANYTLAYTAWSNQPRKLGMIYCYQRPSKIFIVDISDHLANTTTDSVPLEHKLSTPSVYVCRSPRFTPDGKSLIFLGSIEKVSSHNSCFQLLRLNFDTSAVEIIVDKVDVPRSFPQEFPGLFVDQLPRQCFLHGGAEAVLCTQWGSAEAIVSVSLVTKKVTRLYDLLNILKDKNEGERVNEWDDFNRGSLSILDVRDSFIAYTASTPVQLPVTGIYNTITKRIGHYTTPIVPITSRAPSPKSFKSEIRTIKWRVFNHVDTPTGIPYDSILLTPPGDSTPSTPFPVVVVIHGGPHSCTPTSFIASYAYLATLLNTAILHVNYKGSTGFGLRSINSLLGNIGKSDVADVVSMIDHALSLTLNEVSLLDRKRVSVVGGSHGGFLTAHLIGQQPHLFRAAALRNPVTNIPAMFSTTDIPDWCYVETAGGEGYEFGAFAPPTPLALERAYKMSPVYHIKNVVTPTLFCLGVKDKRVPFSQGVEFHHALLSQGAVSKMLLFPEDCHAIDKPASEAEQWIAIADFIAKYST